MTYSYDDLILMKCCCWIVSIVSMTLAGLGDIVIRAWSSDDETTAPNDAVMLS